MTARPENELAAPLKNDNFLRPLRREPVDHTPIWLMRQAGRYLPEYRETRKKAGSFLDLCYTPEHAIEVTLQPIRRFGFDGAILFSDILVVPHALGQDLAFLAGEGPHLSPRLVDVALDSLQAGPGRLDPIYRTVRLVREQLGETTTLLGFVGCARLSGLLNRRPPTVTTESLPSTGLPPPSTDRALASASARAISPGPAPSRPSSSARSSTAAGRTSNSTPAAPSMVRRDALFEARTIISAWSPWSWAGPGVRCRA